MLVILCNKSNKKLNLLYDISTGPAADIWLQCLLKASTESSIESSRFYNFRNQQSASLENLVGRLEITIRNLSPFLPELGQKPLDKTNDSTLQKSLNSLHRNFAHSHLIENSITAENLELWTEFNSLIHQIESALIAKNLQYGKRTLDISRIEFSWKNSFRVPIPENCYSEFTLQKPFGSVQINYCQVGRHLHELYFAGDENIPIEHIQPARFFSANSTLWFGPDLTTKYEVETYAKIENWFMQSKDKFAQAGVLWDRPDKALGSVTVAQLNQAPKTDEEKARLQEKLSEFSVVKSIEIPV